MRAITRLLIAFALISVGAGCGESDLEQVEAPLDTATLAAPGTYGVASFDIEFVDASRTTPSNGTYAGAPQRRLISHVWYPTVAGSGSNDPAAGLFPLIGYGHGYFSNRLEGEAVGSHLASHGYVMVSVDFPLSNGGAPGGASIGDMTNQPGDLAFVMAQVENGGVGANIAAIVDRSRRGIAGLSLGGGTALIAAYHPKWHIENIQAVVAYAPASCFFGPGLFTRSVPFLILSGDRDLLVRLEDGPQRAFEAAQPPISLVTLHGGNHVGFVGLENTDGGNADDIGCLVVGTGGSIARAGADRLAEQLMEGATADVIGDPTQCESTCRDAMPQSMRLARQQELTRAATLAQFEAHLRSRRAAQRWLDETLGAENSDVTVEIRD